jgi:Predicted RNA-binding protein homologous to eukaryotic snRNP
MALDGIILNKICQQLQSLQEGRINKIYQVSQTEVLFHIKTRADKAQLLISCHSQFNRICISNHKYPTPEEPSHFIMLLRKHLENGIIIALEQGDLDRYITITIRVRNEIGDIVKRYLFVELMGKYANIILTDENKRILDALKRIPPYENTKRILQPGANYEYPENQNKKNPFQEKSYDISKSFTEQFAGISPLLGKEIEYRINQGESFTEVMALIAQSKTIYIHRNQDKEEYHCIPLTHLALPYREYKIMEAMDILFYQKEERDRIRQQTGDLFKFTRREIKKNKQKLPKLYESLDEAQGYEKWRQFGELLYAYPHLVQKGMHTISLPSFETNEAVEIPLEEKLDGKQNAKKMFQKYNKLKTGIAYIEDQIQKTEKELEYFQAIEEQLTVADFYDAKEIREELVDYGYLKKKQSKVRKTKKKVKLNYEVISYNDTTTIYIGKNNRQNDYLTWHIAKKDDYWFHAKDFHGAHLVVNTSELDEALIRLCAMLASYYSQGRYSSSVPVNYTQVKNLKKIPKSKLGLVSLVQYQTIYIDVDENILSEYITL